MPDEDDAPTTGGTYKDAVASNEMNVTGTVEESSARNNHSQSRAWADSGVTCKKRNYADIVTEASDARSIQNVLYISVKKLSQKSRPLTSEDIEKLIVDEVNINVDEIKRVDLHSRYESKDIYFNADFDALKYVRPDFIFKDHKIVLDTVKSQFVRFINVPTAVPDEELIYIASFYGTVKDDKIFYETYSDKSNKLRGLENGNRYLFLDFQDGKSMMNYIWWEGPLPSDVASQE